MATIRRRENGKFQVQIRKSALVKAVNRTFVTEAEAVAFVQKYEEALSSGLDLESPDGYLVKDAIRRYRIDLGKDLPKHEHTYLDFWSDAIGNMKLLRFDTDRVLDVLETLRNTKATRGPRVGEGLSAASINRRIARLSAVLKYAHRHLRWINVHPLRAADGRWTQARAEFYAEENQKLSRPRSEWNSVRRKVEKPAPPRDESTDPAVQAELQWMATQIESLNRKVEALYAQLRGAAC